MYLVYKILGIDDPTIKPDSGMPQPGGNPKNFFGDFDLLKKHVAVREKAEVAQRRKGRREPLAFLGRPGYRDHSCVGAVERRADHRADAFRTSRGEGRPAFDREELLDHL